MDTRMAYRKYVKGLGRKRLDELAIFEIGGVGRLDGRGAPVMAALPQRNARRIIYRDIEVLDFHGRGGGTTARGQERAELADRLIQRLRTNGFAIDVVDCHGSLKNHLQGR